MKPSALAFIAVVLLVALGAFALACGDGGGEELTLEEYFQQLGRIKNEMDEREGAIESRFFPAANEDPALAREAYDEFAAIYRDWVSALRAVDPPAEAEGAHQELSAALKALQEPLEDRVARLADVRSTSELENVLTEFREQPEFDAAARRFSDACFALQKIADDNNIAVN